jgi:hypothetical protein
MVKHPTVIIDDFFETPDQIRIWALQQKFYKHDGNYQGLRTDLLSQIDPILQQVMINKILQYSHYQYVEHLYTSFQLIDDSWGDGWIHNDSKDLNIAGIVYLTPNAPDDSGTIIYDEPHPNMIFELTEGIQKAFETEVNEVDVDKRKQLERHRIKHNAQFKSSQVIENRYNRCIIFDCKSWHGAGKYFGNTSETSRLTLPFFCKAR